MDNREAYIVLNSLPEIGPLRVNQLLQCFGEPTAVLSARRDDLLRVSGIGVHAAATITSWRQHCDLKQELELCRRAGVTIVTREDPFYPPLLREIHDPPLCLYVRGCREVLARKGSIAIVGSRRTTRYGVKMAETLASAASLAGWQVVSGLARGIDTVAHEATLRTKGCTVAVIGSGLGRIYPQENIDLARRISATGAVISEFPMHWAPAKRTFPMRNRLIAGMTRGTLVVEAGTRSGSLITAGQAADQNRLVFAVPGRVDSPQSRGCHDLVKQGAKLVETFQDVLDEFTMLPGFYKNARSAEHSSETKETEKPIANDLTLTTLETKLLDLIGTDELNIDELVVDAAEPASVVLRSLLQLEMRRLVRQLPGKRVIRTDQAVVTG